jgi:hypothetical protein
MPDEKSAAHAGEPFEETATSLVAPKSLMASQGERTIARPSTAKAAEQRLRWMWIAGGVPGVPVLSKGSREPSPRLRPCRPTTLHVNGHMTFVAARLPSQELRLLVDDNNRVRKNELLVELD